MLLSVIRHVQLGFCNSFYSFRNTKSSFRSYFPVRTFSLSSGSCTRWEASSRELPPVAPRKRDSHQLRDFPIAYTPSPGPGEIWPCCRKPSALPSTLPMPYLPEETAHIVETASCSRCGSYCFRCTWRRSPGPAPHSARDQAKTSRDSRQPIPRGSTS